MNQYVVIDTETTGLRSSDRIVEISALIVDPVSMTVVDEFDTLINPLRDVGPTQIHGITASMVNAAPTFDEVAPQLSHFLNDRILVAHNLPFDSRMLRLEFERLNQPFDFGTGICTLALTGKNLASACAQHGINHENAHRALADARSTAMLFSRVFQVRNSQIPVQIPTPAKDWLPRTFRRESTQVGPELALVRRASSAIYPTSNPDFLTYLDVLDRYLDDLILNDAEKSSLQALADELNIEPWQRIELHWSYLDCYIQAALRDGVVTAAETELLKKLAHALDIPVEDLPATSPAPTISSLAPGIRVCFTGEVLVNGSPISRTRLEALAAKQGLQPVSSVTKSGCDLLVAADVATGSGKAAKAHQYGIPVMSAAEFLEAAL